ncbi:MAG: toll/interleukin-1 receptor domain-containing protein, partial [Chloroflexota bacterium]
DTKWPSGGSPTCEMMQTFGYFLHDTDGSYLITQKAFALLERPVTLPTVFISYSRKTSSAFGLLIECRLQIAGIKAFIDRSIDPGDAWHAQLEDKIRHSTCVVSLLAPETLNSNYVQKEIQWALDQNIMLIPIWHGTFDGSNIPAALELLGSKNAIRVKEESAEAYHEAVEKLINRLGFVTP